MANKIPTSGPDDEFEAHRSAEQRKFDQLVELGDSDAALKDQLLAEIAAHRAAQRVIDPERFERIPQDATKLSWRRAKDK